jgi:hypothetical protein
MKLVKPIEIPVVISFEDLQLSRDPVTGVVAFDLEPVERVCEANDIDVDTFLTDDYIGARPEHVVPSAPCKRWRTRSSAGAAPGRSRSRR